MKIHKAYLGLLAAALIIFGAASAHAVVGVSGQIWQNDLSNNADTFVPAAGEANATFTVPSIFFDSRITGYTPALWLGSPTFAGANGFSATASLDNSHVTLTGSIYLTSGVNAFTIAHDDGLRIKLSTLGTVLDVPGPTSPVATPFNITNPGAAATFTYTLDYNECSGPPAVLEWSYANGPPVGTVPVPPSVLLLGSGLLGLVGWRFRKS
jgi:hypothetical protein